MGVGGDGETGELVREGGKEGSKENLFDEREVDRDGLLSVRVVH